MGQPLMHARKAALTRAENELDYQISYILYSY